MTAAKAEAPRDNVVGSAGYGHHVAVVDGVTYLFACDDDKKMFDAPVPGSCLNTAATALLFADGSM